MYVLEDTGDSGGSGTSDYTDLENKPSINGVTLEGNLTTQEIGVDNHFKGWYASSSALPSNPIVGDYAYVKGASSTDPAAIYECTTNGTWSDSGRTADTSNVQTFESGEEVNETYIDDTNLVNPKDGALPTADDVLQLKAKLEGVTAEETKATNYTLQAGVLNADTKEFIGTSGAARYTVIPVGEEKRVRFLGVSYGNENTSYYYGFGFKNASDEIFWAQKYEGRNDGGDNVTKEYVVDIPEGAVSLICSVVLASNTLNESNFYCYLQSGDNVIDNVIDKIGEVMPVVSEEVYHSYNLIDPNKVTTKVRLSASNGKTTSTSSSAEYVTGLIEIPERGLYARVINGSSTGGFASWCLYDKNGDYIPDNIEGVNRCGYGDSVTIPYNPQYYKYVRLHSSTALSSCGAVELNADGSTPNLLNIGDYRNGYYEEQIIKFSGFKDRLSVADCMPELLPSLSMCGSNSIKVTAESLEAGTAKSIGAFPNKLRNCFTYTAKMSLAEALPTGEYIRVGNNRNGTIGRTIEITPTNINFLRYVAGTTNAYVTDATTTHGLTIADFLMVEMDCDYTSVTVRIASSDGFFKKTFALNAGYDIWQNQGTPYIIASVNLTDVTFKATSKMFLKPVWTIGASYTVLDPKRWTWQMVNTLGIDNFLVSGMAGDESGTLSKDDASQHNNSNSAFYNLQKCLNFGTPKYLFWGIGMNDATDGRYIYYAKRIEAICRAKGIELIYSTIPNAVNATNTSIVTNKSYINNYVKNSGYRYVDFYGAMCGADGLWRNGYCDDGVHPTELGAKVQAAQVLIDFPEIANYK